MGVRSHGVTGQPYPANPFQCVSAFTLTEQSQSLSSCAVISRTWGHAPSPAHSPLRTH